MNRRVAAAAWCAAGVAAVVPLALDPAGSQRFGPVKLTLLCALVFGGLALAASAGALAFPFARRWLTFGGVLVAATLLGIAPWMSVVGSPRRSEGLVSWALAAGAFALGASVASDRARVLVRRAAVCATIPVALYAVLQIVGVDPLDWEDTLDLDRARSTLGNASFLGSYLVLVGPLVIATAREQSRARWVRPIGSVATGLGAVALAATGSRSAWLGALVAAITAVAMQRRLNRPLLVGGAIALAALAASSVMIESGRGTGSGRIDQWRLTTELVAQRPLLGFGPDTYRSAFPFAIDDQFERAHAAATLHDRAHNLPLDLAASIGLVGLGAAVWLGVGVAGALRRAPRSAFTIAVTAGIAGYLTTLIVGVQEPTLDAIAWLLAGLVVGAPARRVDTTGSGTASATARRITAAGVAVVAVVGSAALATDIAADRVLADALDTLASGDRVGAIARLDDAAALAPHRGVYRQALVRARVATAEATGDIAQARLATEDARKLLRLSPRDGEMLVDRASAHVIAAQIDVARLAAADAAVAEALDAYPSSSRGHRLLGIVRVLGGDADGALAAWERAAALDPVDVDALLNIARLHEQRGDTADAITAYRRALARDPDNATARARLAAGEASD